MGITLDIVRQSYENMDQSKINYRMRRDLPKLFDKKREDPVWQLALTGELREDAGREGEETSASSSTIDDTASSAGRSAKKARTAPFRRTASDGQEDLIDKLRQDNALLTEQLGMARGEQRPLQVLEKEVQRDFSQ